MYFWLFIYLKLKQFEIIRGEDLEENYNIRKYSFMVFVIKNYSNQNFQDLNQKLNPISGGNFKI